MNTTVTANAVYTDAEGIVELVVLDDTDCYLSTVQTLTDEDQDALFAGETEYRVVGRTVEVGDGDTFRRVEVR